MICHRPPQATYIPEAAAVTQIPPLSVTVKEAARLTGLSHWAIRQRCLAGLIESRMEASGRLIDFASLQAYIHSLPSGVKSEEEVTA